MSKTKQPRPTCIFCDSTDPMTKEQKAIEAMADELGVDTYQL